MGPGKYMPTKNTGVTRIFKAAGYSFQGIKYAFSHEAAFREEALAAMVLIPIAIFLPVTLLQSLVLVLAVLFVLLVELLNSAIEAVVDRVGTEYHPLSGAAKDMGSAAVFVALIMAAAIWGVILLQRFF